MGSRRAKLWGRVRHGIFRCRKVPYPDQLAARTALELKQSEGLAVRRVYFCWTCRAWHLTSQDLRT